VWRTSLFLPALCWCWFGVDDAWKVECSDDLVGELESRCCEIFVGLRCYVVRAGENRSWVFKLGGWASGVNMWLWHDTLHHE
jgi:hypothetical protein